MVTSERKADKILEGVLEEFLEDKNDISRILIKKTLKHRKIEES